MERVWPNVEVVKYWGDLLFDEARALRDDAADIAQAKVCTEEDVSGLETRMGELFLGEGNNHGFR